jgi:hypothetical protein
VPTSSHSPPDSAFVLPPCPQHDPEHGPQQVHAFNGDYNVWWGSGEGALFLPLKKTRCKALFNPPARGPFVSAVFKLPLRYA